MWETFLVLFGADAGSDAGSWVIRQAESRPYASSNRSQISLTVG
jgi:hypothetical protein